MGLKVGAGRGGVRGDPKDPAPTPMAACLKLYL